jgi:hypothetical protein
MIIEKKIELSLINNSDEDMIKFLSFVGRNYVKAKGHYYPKGDFGKKSRISDPRDLLKLFKVDQDKKTEKNLYSEEEMINFGKYCHREALTPTSTSCFKSSLDEFKKQ